MKRIDEPGVALTGSYVKDDVAAEGITDTNIAANTLARGTGGQAMGQANCCGDRARTGPYLRW